MAFSYEISAAVPGDSGRPLRATRRDDPHDHCEDRIHAPASRLLPALLGREGRQALAGNRQIRYRIPLYQFPARRTRLERPGPRPADSSAAAASSNSSAAGRKSCWWSRTTASAPSAAAPTSSAPSRSPSRNPCCGASMSPPKRVAGYWWKPRASTCATHMTFRAPSSAPSPSAAPRRLPPRSSPARPRPRRSASTPSRCAFYLPQTKNFPKNTEVEATLTFTTDDNPGPLVPTGCSRRAGGHRARAPFVRRAARCRLPAARVRPARRKSDAGLPGFSPLRLRVRSSSAGSSGIACKRRIQRRALSEPRRADRLLRGLAARRNPSVGARRRCVLVEPGLRSRRVHRRLPVRACFPETSTRWTSATT